MKKLYLLLLLATVSFNAFTQSKVDPKWSEQYHEQQLIASDLIRLIDAVKFKPAAAFKGTDSKTLKAALLRLNEPAMNQINIDAWYLCSTKHDDYFEVWNLYYTKVSKLYWDKNCKGLLALMCVDNTASVR